MSTMRIVFDAETRSDLLSALKASPLIDGNTACDLVPVIEEFFAARLQHYPECTFCHESMQVESIEPPDGPPYYRWRCHCDPETLAKIESA